MPGRQIPRGGTRGTVFREVAMQRIKDAESLKEKARYNGSIYLAGYTIECQLKYAYCKRREVTYLPQKFEVHDWDVLVNAAGLRADIQRQPAIEAIYSALAEQWGPSLRYRTAVYGSGEALRLYNEMEQLYSFLRELEP